MSPRRPSPILLKEAPKPARVDRLKAWIGGVFRRPIAVPTQKKEDEVEEVYESLPPIQSGQSSHRATVQLLPGRLEPLIPEVIQQEVRFQQSSSGEQEVTLGWETWRATPSRNPRPSVHPAAPCEDDLPKGEMDDRKPRPEPPG